MATFQPPKFDLVEIGKLKDNATISNYMREHLEAGAAEVFVFKLLGLKERGKIFDKTGKGIAISSGSVTGYEPINAFREGYGEFHSKETGIDVNSSAFLGYDFGIILNKKNTSAKYGSKAANLEMITSIALTQGDSEQNRATRFRVERSDDGISWKGVGIVVVPDDNQEHIVTLPESAQSRFWRIRPIDFKGSNVDFWCVKKLQMFYYTPTSLSNLNYDMGFMENRSRSYSDQAERIKMQYDPVALDTPFNGFGIFLNDKKELVCHFDACVEKLGRPIVIGDVIELPSEVQYTPDLKPVRKFMEVIDVSWSSDGYTPGYRPYLQKIVAEPLIASEETKDIVKKLSPLIGSELLDLSNPVVQNIMNVNDQIDNQAKAERSEHGIDTSGTSKDFVNEQDIYVQDALPPEGLPYTEGFTLPDVAKAKDDEYFRLIYPPEMKLPARLYKFSCVKRRWIFLEEDLRSTYNTRKPKSQEALTQSPIPARNINK